MLAFLIRAGIFYLAWALLYQSWILPNTRIDRLVVDNLIDIASSVLNTLGYDLIPRSVENEPIRTIGIDGTHGLWVGDPCNGLTLFAVFCTFILAYPATLSKKLWFIPLGIICIHLANVVRISILTIIVKIDYNYLDFNHNYTFSIFVYGIILLLWYWFIKQTKHSDHEK
ncbi:MAG: exosortase family protein XrtF [Flavobacteriales bacterium]|jgi:exosortase family protein XrtF